MSKDEERMSKVLVDRDLLKRIANKAAFLHDTRKDQDKLAAILAAQPAEAEGAGLRAMSAGEWAERAPSRNVVLEDEAIAGLSAVTAERDRLRALSVENILLDVVPGDGEGHEVHATSVEEVETALTAEADRAEAAEAERDQLRAEVERWKAHASNWESVAHKQHRRLKDILRGLASDKALSVFQAPCDIELFPVPCEVIHDDDVLLVIHQRDAAMAAKEPGAL